MISVNWFKWLFKKINFLDMVFFVNYIKYNYYDGCGDKFFLIVEWGWVIFKLKWFLSDFFCSYYDLGGEYLLNSVVYWCSFD